jgi:hypothetical protein
MKQNLVWRAQARIKTTLFGQLYTGGRTYFETTHKRFKYNENFKVGDSCGSFNWIPSKNNDMYISYINFTHNKNHYNEELVLSTDQINPSIYKYKLMINDKRVLETSLLLNLENYTVVDYDANYIIMV